MANFRLASCLKIISQFYFFNVIIKVLCPPPTTTHDLEIPGGREAPVTCRLKYATGFSCSNLVLLTLILLSNDKIPIKSNLKVRTLPICVPLLRFYDTSIFKQIISKHLVKIFKLKTKFVLKLKYRKNSTRKVKSCS